jgi:hypothetical protein
VARAQRGGSRGTLNAGVGPDAEPPAFDPT